MKPCLLCGQQRRLRESHLIPKSIFKWIKDTGSGFLRSGENLDRRIQDGPKAYLLCGECEQQFGNYETYFAKNIFYPIVNDGAAAFSYDEKLRDFVISVLWRLVSYNFLPEEADPDYRALLLALEEEWHAHLLGEQIVSRFNRLHLICGVDPRHPDEIEEIEMPERLIHYFARQVDAGVTGSQEHKFIYLKLPRMLFIVPLQGLPETSFSNSAIYASGIYELDGAACLDPMVGGYFYNRMHQLNGLHAEISPNQQQKIADITHQKWEEVKNKDLGIILDYQRRQ